MSESSALARFVNTIRSYWTGPYTLRDPSFADALGQGETSTGMDVSAYSALNFSAVWAAVAIVSGDIASLPLILYKRNGEAGKTRFVSAKLYELLHDAPNPEMSSFVWRETCQSHVMTWGNAYTEIERDTVGRPINLWPISPDRVTPYRNGSSGYPLQSGAVGAIYYHVSNSSKPDEDIPAADMLHVPGLGFDGLCGYSVVQKARETIGLGLATERFGGTFFGNGSTFGGVLSHPGKLTKEVKQGIRESIDATHTGVDRAHKFVIVGDGMKYEKLGIPPNDAQFLETRRFQVTEIARWFLIPPHKLGDLERATFSNIEQQDIEYYKSGLRRWLVRWEQEINRKLIAPLERKQQFVEHNVDGLLRGDSQARAEYYSKMFNIGAYSINMILEKENMNGIGAPGDVHFVPVNMTTAELAQKGPPAPIPSPAPQPPTPPVGRDDEIDKEFRALLADIAGKTAAIEENVTAARDAESEQAREAQRVALAKLESERDELQRKFDAFRDQHADDAKRLAAEAEAARKETIDERIAREAAEARALEAHVQAVEAKRIQEVAEAERDAAHTQVSETLIQTTNRLTAEAEAAKRETAEAGLAREAAEVRAQEAHGLSVEAKRAQEAAEAERDAARAQVSETLTQTAEQIAAATTEAQARADALFAQQDAEANRLAGMLAAHRALFVHAMGRIVREEVDKARRHQGTSQKFRSWLEAFYVTHEDTCLNALRPAIRVHLAWKQSSEDVEAATLAIVREHIAESTKQLTAVLDGSVTDEFAPMLERTLARWEQQRPEALADRILGEDVAYVRAVA